MIQTTKHNLFQAGKTIPESLDIELCSCDSLKGCGIDHLEQVASQNNKTICDIFKNKQFFYSVSKYKDKRVVSFEVGVGKIVSKNKKTILKRAQAFYCSRDGETIYHDNSILMDFTCFDDEFLTVSQYIPRSYLELLYEPNALIASKDSFSPMSVNIEKDSVVGRLNDSIISIPISSLLTKLIKYNNDKKCVEFFNGEKWIELMEKVNENTA